MIALILVPLGFLFGYVLHWLISEIRERHAEKAAEKAFVRAGLAGGFSPPVSSRIVKGAFDKEVKAAFARLREADPDWMGSYQSAPPKAADREDDLWAPEIPHLGQFVPVVAQSWALYDDATGEKYIPNEGSGVSVTEGSFKIKYGTDGLFSFDDLSPWPAPAPKDCRVRYGGQGLYEWRDAKGTWHFTDLGERGALVGACWSRHEKLDSFYRG